MTRSPLEGDAFVGGRFGHFASFGRAGAIENPDRIGFQLNYQLLNDVLDRLLSVRNRDRAVVLAGCEFTLNEDVSAFQQARSNLGEALTERKHVVPLRYFFPLALVVLPGPCRRDGELRNGGAVC